MEYYHKADGQWGIPADNSMTFDPEYFQGADGTCAIYSQYRLLQDYGFEQISSADARDLRSSVIYQPGFEPEEIKHRINSIVSTLSADYPGKVITDSLQKSHRSIHTSLLGLSVWLGYDSAADMLAAYGFTGLRSDAGRAATDYEMILDMLRQRYEGKVKPDRMSKLLADNPDLKSGLKTMTNRAPELFGMPLVRYFREIGLIAPLEKQETPSKTAQKRGVLIQRIGYRRMVAIGLSACAAAYVLFSMMNSYWMLILGCSMVGLASGIVEGVKE